MLPMLKLDINFGFLELFLKSGLLKWQKFIDDVTVHDITVDDIQILNLNYMVQGFFLKYLFWFNFILVTPKYIPSLQKKL